MLNNATLTRLYGELAPKMLRWLTAGGLDKGLAEDLVHETFLRVWRKRESLEENDALEAFFWTVLRNLRIDTFRRQRPMVSLDSPEASHIFEIPAPQHADHCDASYLRERIQRALKILSPEIQLTFRLFFEEHYSIKEIAARMEAGESLVKVRLHRARMRLRKYLKDLRDPPFE